VLREDIRKVFGALHFAQVDPAASDLVLQPQALGVDVAELP